MLFLMMTIAKVEKEKNSPKCSFCQFFFFIRFNKNISPVCNSLWFMESKRNKFDCANITCKRCLQFGSIVMLFCWHCMCWIWKRYCWNRINQKMNIKKNENSAIRLTISVLKSKGKSEFLFSSKEKPKSGKLSIIVLNVFASLLQFEKHIPSKRTKNNCELFYR